MPQNKTPDILPADFFDKTPETLPADFFEKKPVSPTQETIGMVTDPTVQAQHDVQGIIAGSPEEAEQMRTRKFQGGDISQIDAPSPLTNPLTRIGAPGVGTGFVGPIAGTKMAVQLGKNIISDLAALKSAKSWQKLNEVIGAKPSSIRIGKGASIESAATNPGRGLANEKIYPSQLKNIAPDAQAAKIKPLWNAAGQKVDQTLELATQAGTKVDATKGPLAVLDRIKDPTLRNKAIAALDKTAQELGLNVSEMSPVQARNFRDALKSSANFNTEELRNLPGIRAQLSRGVARDMHDQIPGLKSVDQHYSDLNQAMTDIQGMQKKVAVKGMPQSPVSKFVRKVAPWVAATAAGSQAGRAYRFLTGQ